MCLLVGRTNHAAKTKSEEASAEDSGSYNFHRNRVPGMVINIVNRAGPPLSMYIVLESILFVLTEGCSWRAIDRRQARWNSVYQYFRRWCQRGTLQKVLTRFGPELVRGWHFVDSTHVKVHADGSNPAGGQAAQAMGRTKGGLNTKIHALVNARSQQGEPAAGANLKAFNVRVEVAAGYCV